MHLYKYLNMFTSQPWNMPSVHILRMKWCQRGKATCFLTQAAAMKALKKYGTCAVPSDPSESIMEAIPTPNINTVNTMCTILVFRKNLWESYIIRCIIPEKINDLLITYSLNQSGSEYSDGTFSGVETLYELPRAKLFMTIYYRLYYKKRKYI